MPSRIAVLYGGNMLATAFSGLIAAGSTYVHSLVVVAPPPPKAALIHATQRLFTRRTTTVTANMEGAAGRPAWEWLFIIEGSITVAIAILLLPLMPDYPLQSKHWLLPRNLQLYAVSLLPSRLSQSLSPNNVVLIQLHSQEWRIRKENAGIIDEDADSVWWGLKQALVDPKLYMFIALMMSLITAESFSNFFPSIVGTLGYNSTNTLLLTSPPYFFAFFVSLAVSFHASRSHERGYHIAVPMVFALLGNLMVGVVSPFNPAHQY